MELGANQTFLVDRKLSSRCTLRKLGFLGYMIKRDQKFTRTLYIIASRKACRHTGTTMKHESQPFVQISPCKIKNFSSWGWTHARIENKQRVVSSCSKCTNSSTLRKLQRNIRKMCQEASNVLLQSNRTRRLVLPQRKEVLSNLSEELLRVASWRRRSVRRQFWQKN